ncbi:MAG: hypothetical protein MJ058_08720 [Akkermansia sp.]|nr:hypothetical protein [Akkermansia sp.]
MTDHRTNPETAEPLPPLPPELMERLLAEIECGAPATDAEVAETEALLLSCRLLPPTELQVHRMRAAVLPRSYGRRVLAAAAALALLVLPAALFVMHGREDGTIPLRSQTYIITDPADRSEIIVRVKEHAVAVPDDVI